MFIVVYLSQELTTVSFIYEGKFYLPGMNIQDLTPFNSVCDDLLCDKEGVYIWKKI